MFILKHIHLERVTFELLSFLVNGTKMNNTMHNIFTVERTGYLVTFKAKCYAHIEIQ